MGAGCSNARAADAAAPNPAKDDAAAAGARAAARKALISKCFAALDFDGSGNIELQEWKKYLIAAGVASAVVEEQAAMMMQRMDKDNDAQISLTEFITALLKLTDGMSDEEFSDLMAGVVNACRDAAAVAGDTGTRSNGGEKLSALVVKESLVLEMRVAKLRLCFNALDMDKSGYIEVGEFKQYLQQTGAADSSLLSDAESLMAKMDADGDRKVSLEEYMCSMADFKNTVSDEAFTKLVDGIFGACAGKVIGSNVLEDALNARLQ